MEKAGTLSEGMHGDPVFTAPIIDNGTGDTMQKLVTLLEALICCNHSQIRRAVGRTSCQDEIVNDRMGLHYYVHTTGIGVESTFNHVTQTHRLTPHNSRFRSGIVHQSDFHQQ